MAGRLLHKKRSRLIDYFFSFNIFFSSSFSPLSSERIASWSYLYRFSSEWSTLRMTSRLSLVVAYLVP